MGSTNSLEKAVLHQICAYHYIPSSKLSLFHTIFNQNLKYSEKVKAIILGLNCSKIDDIVETDSVGILSHLINETLKDRSSCAENLLLLATSLKTSVKQFFTSCSPELFYMLLLEGGAAIRRGDHSEEVPSKSHLPYIIYFFSFRLTSNCFLKILFKHFQKGSLMNYQV